MSAPAPRNKRAFDLISRPGAVLLAGLLAAGLLAIGAGLASGRALRAPIADFVYGTLQTLYPWAASGAATAPDVAHFYLNVPAFAAVGFVAVIGWATIGALPAAGPLACSAHQSRSFFTASPSAS